jgi:leucyl aminopeptidase (aminopeptidase T)
MAPRSENGEEPPPPVAEALAASDVFIAPTLKSLSHTQSRKRASERGARGATLPGVTADMLARLMAIDFDVMGARSKAVAELLGAADTAHVTCPRGTDLTLDLTGRSGIADDGELTAPGAFGNLPCGEGFIAPVEGSVEGTLVIDGSIAEVGQVETPVALTIREGHLVEATGSDGARLMELLTAHGEDGTNVAELGIGTNEEATLTGNILEDEKILGTAHVAFGASAAIGGTVQVPVHLDCVVLEPTIEIDGERIAVGGELLL